MCKEIVWQVKQEKATNKDLPIKNQSYKEKPYKDGVAYDSDSEMLRDIRYDVKYIPEDHYEE